MKASEQLRKRKKLSITGLSEAIELRHFKNMSLHFYYI